MATGKEPDDYTRGRDCKTSVEIKFIELPVNRPLEYVEEWFSISKTKPSLILWKYNCDPDDFAKIVMYDHHTNALTIEMFSAFIRYVFVDDPLFKTTLIADWTSFGQQIGLANTVVRPADLINIVDGGDITDITRKLPATRFTNLQALFTILSSYRHQSTPEAGRQNTAAMLDRTGKTLGLTDNFAQNSGLTYSAWKDNPLFRKICAIVDMFLQKIPRHEYSLLRVATVCSRYKDCTVLLAYQHIRSLTGLTGPLLASWLLTHQLHKEYKQLWKAGNELQKSDSYMPYFMDLQMSSVSPYSAPANPNLHFFLHSVGCTLRSARSINAMFVGAPEVTPILGNVALLSAMIGISGYFQVIQTKDPEKIKELQRLNKAGSADPGLDEDAIVANRERIIDLDDLTGIPTTKHADEWLDFLEDQDGAIPTTFHRNVHRIWASLIETRDSSIGDYLQKYAETSPYLAQE